MPLKLRSRVRFAAAAGRKCRIDVNAVAGRIVVLLRDVDLRVGRETTVPPQKPAATMKMKRVIVPEIDDPRSRPLQQHATVCQGFTAAHGGAKVTGLSFSLERTRTRLSASGQRASYAASASRTEYTSAVLPRIHCVLRKWRALLVPRFNFYLHL